MKYKFFLPAVAWVTAALFSGAAAKPLLGVDDLSPPQAETTPKPDLSCSFPSLENNDGLCTCWFDEVPFTTFTPDGGPGNDCHSSTIATPSSLLAPTATTTTADPKISPANPNNFYWAVIGDSWSSGVSYSYGTSLAPWSDVEYCYRSNQAYGSLMYYDASSWIDSTQQFSFVACGGTKMDDIPRQLDLTRYRFWRTKARPQLLLGTFGGNDGFFGDIARACIYKPDPGGPWGPDYDNDPNGTGWCKKYLKQARDFIDDPQGLEVKFRETIDYAFGFSNREPNPSTRLDFYVSSYVKFFNAETDACDGWTFARWFSTGSPKLVKALRREMNELVGKFNDVQEKVITWYQPPPSTRTFTLHYVPISDIFEGHRFCEPNHSFDDHWYSADVWLWNLSWKNGNLSAVDRRRQETDSQQDEDASMNLKYSDNGVMRMGKPPDAEDGPFPLLSLSVHDRNDLDEQDLPSHDSPVEVDSQSGFGWSSRPFHPKPNGNKAMMAAYIAAFRRDKVPGVRL
ncbi:SGNH hydrolase-type esterase domain-containing protein [Rhypophila decipiens]|uniref:SGNH hydrolase-type esterase domain-containing protein n=1 Tax=Rhypophila decipiens TaxID=261697 RepID=A0AAN6XXE0_9PEZI|nr:SGNH hydrolase-type esterase domain-containing protein [Rhypophila decipiens]